MTAAPAELYARRKARELAAQAESWISSGHQPPESELGKWIGETVAILEELGYERWKGESRNATV